MSQPQATIYALPIKRSPRSSKSVNRSPAHTYSRFQLSRVHDILCLSLQRRDYIRARRAWSILSRSGATGWEAMWRLGLATLGDVDQMDSDSISGKERVEYLKTCLLKGSKTHKEEILTELVLTLIKFGRYRDAYDELGFYLPSFPYHENVALNTYAGMVALQLAFSAASPNGSASSIKSQPNINLLRESKTHFERVKLLKPDDSNALAFIAALESLNSDGEPDAHSILECLGGKENGGIVGGGDGDNSESQ